MPFAVTYPIIEVGDKIQFVSLSELSCFKGSFRSLKIKSLSYLRGMWRSYAKNCKVMNFFSQNEANRVFISLFFVFFSFLSLFTGV